MPPDIFAGTRIFFVLLGNCHCSYALRQKGGSHINKHHNSHSNTLHACLDVAWTLHTLTLNRSNLLFQRPLAGPHSFAAANALCAYMSNLSSWVLSVLLSVLPFSKQQPEEAAQAQDDEVNNGAEADAGARAGSTQLPPTSQVRAETC